MEIRTHRGFVVNKSDEADRNDRFYANPTVDELYLQLINNPVVTQSWEWEKNAIQVIASIFAATPRFFEKQLRGEEGRQHMSPRSIDFLHSCLTFIQTGRRRLSAPLWLDLLDIHPKDTKPVTTAVLDDFELLFKDLLKAKAERLIPMWVSQPGGLADLVTSAYILFGAIPANWKDD